MAGIAQAQVGDLVGTSTLLTTVSQVDPIKVSFPVSEKLYLHFAGQINASGDANAKSSPPIELILDNGSVYSYPGRLYAVNRQVDVQTGTIMMQAIFPNPENILRPGMYAKVRAQTDVAAQRAARSSDRRLFDSRTIRGCGSRRRQQGDAPPGNSRHRRPARCG